jgi:hypothetical protein
MINTLDLFMQLTAGTWPPIQLPAPPPRLKLRPRRGPPGCNPRRPAGYPGTPHDPPQAAESVTTALITKLLTNPLA